MLHFRSNEISSKAVLSKISSKLTIQLRSKRISPPWSLLTPREKVRVYWWISDVRRLFQHHYCSLLLLPLPANTKQPKVLVTVSEIYNMVIVTNVILNRLYRMTVGNHREVSRRGERNRYIGRLRGIVPWNAFRDLRMFILEYRAFWYDLYSAEVMLNRAYNLNGNCCSLLVNYISYYGPVIVNN